VVVVEPDEIHTGQAATATGWHYRMFYPEVDLLREIATELSDKPGGTPHFPEAVVHDAWVSALLVQLHLTLDRSDDRLARSSLTRRAFGALLMRHSRRPSEARRIGAERAVVRQARGYLMENLAENLGLEELARRVDMSPYHLLRVFRAATGQTPHAFRNQQRLIQAKALLRSGMPIAEVAMATGFNDQSHFTNRFRRMVGVPPGEYRRQRH
jgi:AraC-like DNA-binding protein